MLSNFAKKTNIIDAWLISGIRSSIYEEAMNDPDSHENSLKPEVLIKYPKESFLSQEHLYVSSFFIILS